MAWLDIGTPDDRLFEMNDNYKHDPKKIEKAINVNKLTINAKQYDIYQTERENNVFINHSKNRYIKVSDIWFKVISQKNLDSTYEVKSTGKGKDKSKIYTKRYTNIYDKTPLHTTATLNAGDPGLYVGGGGINKAFKDALDKQNTDEYEALHKYFKDIHKKDSIRTDIPVKYKKSEKNAKKDSENLKSITVGKDGDHYCFLDVFKDDKRPLHKNNAAMLYIIGPNRSDEKFKNHEGFYEEVRKVADLAIRTMNHYNNEKSREKIEVLRFNAFSNASFLGKSSNAADYETVIQTIVKAVIAAKPKFKIEFAHIHGYDRSAKKPIDFYTVLDKIRQEK